MGMEINKTDSTVKATTQGAVAGAAIGTGVGAGVILAPVAKDSFVKSIANQSKYIANKTQTVVNTLHSSGCEITEETVTDGIKKYFAKQKQLVEDIVSGAKTKPEVLVEEIAKKGEKSILKNVAKNEKLVLNGTASKTEGVKKAFEGIKDKIKTVIENFKATPNKLDWVKNHKTQLQKLLIPAAVGAGVAALTVLTVKAVKNHKAQKEIEQ